MAILTPRIVRAKQFLRRSSFTGNHNSANIPKGYFAVYVGEGEKKRFVDPISYLKHSSFKELLNQAEEEFGFDHPMGGLTIPCREDVFIDLMTSQLSGI